MHEERHDPDSLGSSQLYDLFVALARACLQYIPRAIRAPTSLTGLTPSCGLLAALATDY